jgi:hypothetical protein
MPAPLFAEFDLGSWTTWVSLGAGVLVASLVIGSTAMYWRWRPRRGPSGGLTDASREEDLPWNELLAMINKRKRDRAAIGLPPQLLEEELGELLAKLPAVGDAAPLELQEDREFISVGGAERRDGRRRWGNPTAILMTAPGSADQQHGLVVNRSTGGLGILTDKALSPGELVTIRPVEAPSYIPEAHVQIRHCRNVGKAVLLGCEFCQDIPWNVRVWFG